MKKRYVIRNVISNELVRQILVDGLEERAIELDKSYKHGVIEPLHMLELMLITFRIGGAYYAA